MIPVSSDALCAVDVGSWLIGVVELGLMVLMEAIEDMSDTDDVPDIADMVDMVLAVAFGTEANDSSPGPESSCRLSWRTCDCDEPQKMILNEIVRLPVRLRDSDPQPTQRQTIRSQRE